jgi:hypothetical protein
MDAIKTAFLQGLITGLIPMFFTAICYLAWHLGVWASEREEMKRLKRKALQRQAGEE